MPNRAHLLGQIWKALKQLNPNNVEKEAGRQVSIGVVGDVELLQDATAFLLGKEPGDYDKAKDSLLLVATPPDAGALALLPRRDVVLVAEDYTGALPGVSAERIFRFAGVQDLPTVVKHVLRRKNLDYARLPLARTFPGFRPEVAIDTIQTVSVENAVFVTSTALGNVIPNPLQALTSLAESVGDLVVLTANQIRMLFRLAAIHGREMGIRNQSPEVLSIVGAAFGWRSIARELVSKIPFGGGVVPKAAIAFAGTWAVGESITFYYTSGRKMTKEEMRQRFEAAMVRGRAWAEQLMARLKYADEALSRLKESCERGRGAVTGKPDKML